MSNLVKRALFGGIFIAVFIGALYLGNFVAGTFFGLVAVIGSFEIERMIRRGGRINVSMVIAPSFLAGSIANQSVFLGQDYNDLSRIIILLGVVVYGALIFQLFANKTNLFEGKWLTPIFGQLYVWLPFGAMFFFVQKFNPMLLLGILIVIWANDTFAYLIGKQIGKTKLFERISPNKTWEGSIGGAFVALIIAVLVNPIFFEELGKIDWFFVGLISIIFGAIGDLLESMYKRYYGVKDSGNVIPGHGGVLDRFDALMGAVPFVMTYLYFV